MAKIFDRNNYLPPGEENDGEILVETAGYIPADRKIESMIDAGRRLMDFRAGYEFQDGEDVPMITWILLGIPALTSLMLLVLATKP